MNIWDAIVQGFLQGLTEFLPISSSGHLAVYNYFFNSEMKGETIFTVLLHLGTLLAVFLVYHKTIWQLIQEFFRLIGDIFTGKFKWSTMSPIRRMLIMLVVTLLPLFLFLPFADMVKAAGNNIIIMGCCFLFTAVLLYFGHRAGKMQHKRDKMTVVDALVIGFFQGVATLPGISRSGSTISAGLFRGLKKDYVMRFSFILSIPTILAAAVLDFKDSADQLASLNILPAIVGIAVAAIVGFFAIKFIQYLIKTDKFHVFAIYCLALGLLLILEGIYEAVAGHMIFAG